MRLAVALEGERESREVGGAVLVESGQRVTLFEGEAQGGARHEGARGEHEQGEIGAFDGALQAIPERSGHAAQFVRGSGTQIEHDEAEVGIAGKEVGDGEGGGGGAAARPDEVLQVGGRMGLGVEAVGGVNQRDALPGLARDGEQMAEQEVAAAAGRGAHAFGQSGERKATAGEVIDRRQVRAQAGSGRPGSGRKARGDEVPKRRQRWSGRRNDGD